jgi:hypothetical protein
VDDDARIGQGEALALTKRIVSRIASPAVTDPPGELM